MNRLLDYNIYIYIRKEMEIYITKRIIYMDVLNFFSLTDNYYYDYYYED